MKNNLILGLSTILAVSACSSKTTTLAPKVNFASLITDANGLVTLPANQVVNLSTAAEVLKIKFHAAPTGAKVEVDSLTGLSDVTIEVKEGISGDAIIEVTGTPVAGDQDPISYKLQSDDLDSILKAEIETAKLDQNGAHVNIETVILAGLAKIGVNVVDYNPVKEASPGTESFDAPNTTVTLNRVTFTVDADDAKSYVQGSVIQNDNTLKIGVDGKYVPNLNLSSSATTSIKDGDIFKADAEGEFKYKGATAVVADDWTYLDVQSELTMNFGKNTGTYSSSNFEADGDGDNANDELSSIVITGSLSLNNTTGAITSTTGTVVSTNKATAASVTSEIDINAAMTTDHSAVAGAFMVKKTERSNQPVEAGVFGFVKNENITK